MKRADFKGEFERVLSLLPQEPPAEGLPFLINNKSLQFTNLLIYRHGYGSPVPGGKREKGVIVHCTACGMEHFRERSDRKNSCLNADPFGYIGAHREVIRSGSSDLCPACFAQCEAMHVSRISKEGRGTNGSALLTVHRFGDSIALLSWYYSRMVFKDGTETVKATRMEGAVFCGGYAFRVTSEINNGMSSYTYLDRWSGRERMYDAIGRVPRAHVLPFDRHLTDGTALDRSGFYEYVSACAECFPVSYLTNWKRYPNLENLVKSGYSWYLNKCADGGDIGRFGDRLRTNIDLHAARPHRMIGLDKDEMRALRSSEMQEILCYKEIRDKLSIRLSKEDLKRLLSVCGYWGSGYFTSDLHGYRLPLFATISYIEKQRLKCPGSYLTVRDYRDYLDAVFFVNGAITKDLLFPRNLKAAHDDWTERRSVRLNEEKKKLISAAAKKNRKMFFEDGETGLLIRPIASYTELVNEGKILHHCVATYADRIAQGSTLILCIRHIDAPKEPYFTLEYKDGNVIQNRGLRNCARTEDVQIFEEKWLRHLRSGKVVS